MLTARHAVVVATGSSALLPDIAGLRESAPWTSREAAAASRVPLWHAVPAFPTISEVWLRLLEAHGR